MPYPKQVYAIQHNRTGRIYIGSSHDVAQRFWNHMNALRAHRHTNKTMQEDFDKYGEDYSLYILDDIEWVDEADKEYEWMVRLKTTDPDIGYNGNDKAVRKLKKCVPPFKPGIPVPNESGD